MDLYVFIDYCYVSIALFKSLSCYLLMLLNVAITFTKLPPVKILAGWLGLMVVVVVVLLSIRHRPITWPE